MLGTLELRMGGKTLRQIPLVAAEEVPTQSFLHPLLNRSSIGRKVMNNFILEL